MVFLFDFYQIYQIICWLYYVFLLKCLCHCLPFVMLASSGTLAVIMGVRAYNSRKFMPAGMIAALRFVNFF